MYRKGIKLGMERIACEIVEDLVQETFFYICMKGVIDRVTFFGILIVDGLIDWLSRVIDKELFEN